MKKVFSFLKPYKLPIIIAYSLTFIELIAELLLPFFLGKMINEGVKGQDLDNIVMWGAIMIGLAFFSFIAGIINSFYASHTSSSFALDIREKLFQKIQTFSFNNLSKFPTSSLVTRFTNDVRQVQNTIFMGLRVMIRAPLLVIGSVIMAFIINVQLSLIFLATVPILTLFLFWVLRRASSMFEKVQAQVDHVNRIMQENLIGMRLIKAFLRRGFEKKQFIKANTNLATTTKSTTRFVESSMPVLLFVMNMSLIFIIWFGNIQSVTGETAVGDIIAIINYALRIAMAISMFTFITMAFSRAKASSDRLSSVLSVQVDLVDNDQIEENAAIVNGKISFEHVSFTYPRSVKPVLENISFSVNHRESLAILGATGAGKTTLFQLIPRLYNVDHGTIYIDDLPATAYSLDTLRGSIGYVPQSPLLFSGSIFDNIAWGKENATLDEVITAAKDAQIHETIMKLPNQYETTTGQRGVNFSGGQQQRVSIARALIRKPKILMLDDSTSALDLTTESKLLDAIDKYACTTIIITQKVSTAIRTDRILLMDHSKVLAIGTHKQLIQQSTLYQKIVESQFGKELPNAY